MKINLTYYLKRKNFDLKLFLKINNLTSYNQLVEFCKLRSFVPIDENEYNKIIKPPAKNAVKKKTTRRKTSKTQKKESVGNNSRVKPNTRNVSDSGDKKQD
jgi:hypothetical protein